MSKPGPWSFVDWLLVTIILLDLCFICFEFEIRPQYLFSDIKRNFYHALEEYHGAKVYFSHSDFYIDEELEKAKEIARRFRKESRTLAFKNAMPSFKFALPRYVDEIHAFAAAHCEVNEVIVLDPHYWKHATALAKERLIFHELGHCLLDAEHTRGKITIQGREISSSIMDEENSLNDGDYVLNRDYYLRELFSRVTVVQ